MLSPPVGHNILFHERLDVLSMFSLVITFDELDSFRRVTNSCAFTKLTQYPVYVFHSVDALHNNASDITTKVAESP
jgi:hypothetical protein